MKRLPAALIASAAFALLVSETACSRQPAPRQFTLHGQVLAVRPERREIIIKHDDIKGFMPAMTMPFTVKDKKWLDGRAPGDVVDATLVVQDAGAYLSRIEKVGSAPISTATAVVPGAVELVEPGQPVPDISLVDQDGRPIQLGALRGLALVITFVYTRCPMPNFCPLMDKNFAAIQQAVKDDARLRGRVRLLSISFDPAHDTPQVLKQHAAGVGADSTVWSYLTGDQQAIDRFASRFGLSVVRDANDPSNIVHNLRTAVVDREGKLVKVFGGSDWTPDQVVSALAWVAAS
jgi:protein SCO1/2